MHHTRQHLSPTTEPIPQSVQRGKLPIEVLVDPFYGESNIRELERRARDMDADRNISEHQQRCP